MTPKRRVLSVLTKPELLEICRAVGLEVPARKSVDQLRDALAKSKLVSMERVLPLLGRDTLKNACLALGVVTEGRENQVLVDRLLAAVEGKAAETKRRETQAAPQTWLPMPEVRAPVPATAPTVDAEVSPSVQARPKAVADNEISIEVQPRKPRLAWQGMWRVPAVTPVPTQVVEIVRPARAQERKAELGLDTRVAAVRDNDEVTPNRLIWTNDNLVALKTLLDERDERTRDYKYRGKVDLIYIDPPFMVNSDFCADNAIEIELDDDAGVQARKEPSLVEILAYKDTWRQGLDSFLSMLRQRLVVLKDLLAPSGSIYVHLDWHAAHYVKAMMDELFGYENFQHEIIWKRTSARSDAQGFNHVHDTILSYSNGSPVWNPVFGPLPPETIRSHYSQIDEKTGRRYTLDNLTSPNPRPNMMYEWKGYPSPPNGWRYSRETMAEMDRAGLIHYPGPGKRLRFKRFLDDEGMPIQSVWTDLPAVNSQAAERLGYPTQKPVELLSRIISASSPPGGLVLDCFLGSGTTAEAAERTSRRWIGIDNGKYAVHLSRKRMIQLHGQPRPAAKPQYDYVECKPCGNIERKEKPQKSAGAFDVRPFTVENMGAYQRAEAWQDFQLNRSRYRDEMIKVFGGEPTNTSPLLHGKKGQRWVHVGPLDGPVSEGQVWNIAREAAKTSMKAVDVLSADFDTLSASQKSAIEAKTGVHMVVRVIPASAIDEVKRRLELQRASPETPIESMAIPAFYAPLAISLSGEVDGRIARVTLNHCEVDIESFLASQRPAMKAVLPGMSPAARKKAEGELAKWEERKLELERWLKKATSWQKFIDFWAVDFNYGHRVGNDGKPVFESDWQSFRTRRGKGETDALSFTAEVRYPDAGAYQIGARVTDVFGNDGIATVKVEIA